MNKQEIQSYLTQQGISFQWTEHEAVYTMEQLSAVALPHPEAEAKNLFVRDDKKRNYYLITVPPEARVNLKEFQQLHGLRKLSFASAEDLAALLGLIPGAVSPLGLLNDQDHRVVLYLHRSFDKALISIHPNDNTATVCLSTDDLIRILQDHGSELRWIEE